MKGYKFYLEYPTLKDRRKATRKNKGGHSGNCLAIPDNDRWDSNGELIMGCISAAYMYEDSECCYGACSGGYLEQCIRISETEARKIHPNLFKYLEQ